MVAFLMTLGVYSCYNCCWQDYIFAKSFEENQVKIWTFQLPCIKHYWLLHTFSFCIKIDICWMLRIYLSSRKVWIQQPMQQLFQQPGLNQDDPHQFCTLVVPLSCLPVFPSNHDPHLLLLPKSMSHVNVCWEFVNQKLQLQNCHCMLKIYVGY